MPAYTKRAYLKFQPSISVEDAENISKDGYRSMLENLIQMFKDGHLSWMKQGKVFLLHLLDDMVPFPMAIYHLEKCGDYNVVKSRVIRLSLYGFIGIGKKMRDGPCLQCLLQGLPFK